MNARYVLAEILLAAALLFHGSAHAISISFEPLSQDVAPGSSADVALLISGLGDFASPSVSTFDLDVTFDPAILALDSAVFGDPVLGDQLDLFGLGTFSDVVPRVGVVNLFQLSFDSPSDLDTLQAGSFILATLTFEALAFGRSPLELSINALGDAFGDPLPADVSSGINVIPEPSAILLLSFAIGALALLPRRRPRKRSRC